MGGGEEKTEPATPKKKSDERKKGNIAMSQDVVTVASLFAAILVLRLTFGSGAEALGEFMQHCFDLIRGDVVPAVTSTLFFEVVVLIFRVSGPLLAVCIFASAFATMAQSRLLVTTETLKPKFSKINPMEGFKRLFSLKSLVQTGMNLLKIILLLVIIYNCVRDLIDVGERYIYAELTGACTHLFSSIFSMLLRVGMAFAVLAAVDFFYQRWNFEKQMRMTKQEVKEEYKQTEGDPQIKGRIKQLQRQMSMSRMMQQVPQADVIIRNPTHVAVALRYHPGEDAAPVVLAMGVDYMAQRIIAAAESHEITIIENVALARAIYAEATLNQPIPPALYEAVAEVMVYLYKLGKLEA